MLKFGKHVWRSVLWRIVSVSYTHLLHSHYKELQQAQADTVHLRGKVVHCHNLKAEQHGAGKQDQMCIRDRLSSDPLMLDGIADSTAKYATARANGALNIVFNGIWSRKDVYKRQLLPLSHNSKAASPQQACGFVV